MKFIDYYSAIFISLINLFISFKVIFNIFLIIFLLKNFKFFHSILINLALVTLYICCFTVISKLLF